jgi:carbon-monoxide dehydrogenase large subunit
VRFVGDYVAFVVAETKNQAMDASELIEVDYEILPATVATADAAKPGATLVWDDCKDNICFVAIHGDKAKTEEAFAKAAHVVKEHLVINRVTTASMEPRGSVGDYNAIEDRYTIYTTLQRAHPYRAELAKLVLKVPEHKVRVVAPDIGGSFGMKSAIYNEVPLVLLASKKIGRPVKWMSTRSEAFLSDAQARDNVTNAELALDKDGTFLGFRVMSTVNAGAYLQSGFQAYTGNLGTLAGVYRTPAMYVESTAVFSHTQPMRPYRGNGRPEAAYVIERMVDVAAATLKMDPAELRRKNYIPPQAMPFKTSLTFTYDSGEFEKGMDLALKMADVAGFAKRKAESKKNGKLRGLGMSNTIERAAAPSFRAPKSASTAAAPCRSFPAASTRARATRPRSSRWWPTSSACIRTTSSTSRATPTRCSSAKAPAARARPPCRARRSIRRRRRSSPRPRRSPRTISRSMSRTSISPMACSPAPRPTRP